MKELKKYMDRANASFIRDNNCKSPIGVSAFSKRKRIQYDNTLQGYYDWIVKNIVPIKEKLVPTYRYVGEWLVPHEITYKEECYNFYLFGIWDEETEEYLPDDLVMFEAARLGLNKV